MACLFFIRGKATAVAWVARLGRKRFTSHGVPVGVSHACKLCAVVILCIVNVRGSSRGLKRYRPFCPPEDGEILRAMSRTYLPAYSSGRFLLVHDVSRDETLHSALEEWTESLVEVS